jgi:S1-C subfamily serine protease
LPSRSDPPVTDEAAVAGAPPGESSPTAISAEHAELRRQGAKAAARGEVPASNPMLDSINQPGATGESQQAWFDRRDAWEHGHTAQQSPALIPARALGEAAANDRLLDEALFGVTRVLTFSGAQGLATASGFFFETQGRLFLVTSRHVLCDATSGHVPDRLEIELHTDSNDLTRSVMVSIPLHREGRAAWRQLHDGAGAVDVAALEIDQSALPARCVLRPFGPQHLSADFDLVEVGDRLVIPGFPRGFFDTVHHLPVARQASVASCYGVRFQGQGCFLTDARTHRGFSGSPVLAHAEALTAGGPRWHLLGVHATREGVAGGNAAPDESLGLNCAWYADVLTTLTTGASPTRT